MQHLQVLNLLLDAKDVGLGHEFPEGPEDGVVLAGVPPALAGVAAGAGGCQLRRGRQERGGGRVSLWPGSRDGRRGALFACPGWCNGSAGLRLQGRAAPGRRKITLGRSFGPGAAPGAGQCPLWSLAETHSRSLGAVAEAGPADGVSTPGLVAHYTTEGTCKRR